MELPGGLIIIWILTSPLRLLFTMEVAVASNSYGVETPEIYSSKPICRPCAAAQVEAWKLAVQRRIHPRIAHWSHSPPLLRSCTDDIKNHALEHHPQVLRWRTKQSLREGGQDESVPSICALDISVLGGTSGHGRPETYRESQSILPLSEFVLSYEPPDRTCLPSFLIRSSSHLPE